MPIFGRVKIQMPALFDVYRDKRFSQFELNPAREIRTCLSARHGRILIHDCGIA
jgi:hypothetical protein